MENNDIELFTDDGPADIPPTTAQGEQAPTPAIAQGVRREYVDRFARRPRPPVVFTEADFIEPGTDQPLPRTARNFPLPIQAALRAVIHGKGITYAKAAKAFQLAQGTIARRADSVAVIEYRAELGRRLLMGRDCGGTPSQALDQGGAGEAIGTLRAKHRQIMALIEALPAHSPRIPGLIRTGDALLRSISGILSPGKAATNKGKPPESPISPSGTPSGPASAPVASVATLPTLPWA